MSRHDKKTSRDYVAERRARAASKVARAEAEARRQAATTAALRRERTAPVESDDAARFVFSQAPRLAEGEYATAVKRVLALQSVRPLVTWSPRGKGREALFRSLAEHLLARYAMPAMLWSVFFDAHLTRLVGVVARVAGGGSLVDAARDPEFPIPLTRRLCHEVMSDRASGTLLHTIRRAQVRAAGGDARLFTVWMRTQQAQTIDTREGEVFWASVLGWLVKNPVEPEELGPVLDYVAHRRAQEVSFSMSGRTAAAVRRAVEEWHRDLAQQKLLHGALFAPSGFCAAKFDLSATLNGTFSKRIWRVEEIRTGKELFEEGKRMGHCVYSYAGRVSQGDTSIWAMTFEDGQGPTGRWSMLTIEVRKTARAVVQARGRFNRSATSAEHAILVRWAGSNNLSVSV